MRRVFYLESAAAVTPPARAPPPPCEANKCPWWPYSSSDDFKSGTALIIVVLLCALICALALNVVVRCFIRQHCRRRREREMEARKSEMVTVLSATPYSEEMRMTGSEMECIICLSDFAVGEQIMFLDKCRHGFHVQCIQKWLASHSSCPTCRTECEPENFTQSD